MYKCNDIVECDGRYGRVVYFDPTTYTVHVLIKLNEYTWKLEKVQPYMCNPAQVFLWTIESAFRTWYRRNNKTPELVPMVIDDDHFMHIV